jgi:hypothetical protein
MMLPATTLQRAGWLGHNGMRGWEAAQGNTEALHPPSVHPFEPFDAHAAKASRAFQL